MRRKTADMVRWIICSHGISVANSRSMLARPCRAIKTHTFFSPFSPVGTEASRKAGGDRRSTVDCNAEVATQVVEYEAAEHFRYMDLG